MLVFIVNVVFAVIRDWVGLQEAELNFAASLSCILVGLKVVENTFLF